MIEMDGNPASEQLKRLLERFIVSYEVYPESVVLPGRGIRQVAYEVDLYGIEDHEPPLRVDDERCKEIFRALYGIARWSLPNSKRACHIDIGGFDASLHYLDGWQGPGSVQLNFYIRHLDTVDGALDNDQKSALEEVIQRLEALGVYHTHDSRCRRGRIRA